MNFFGCFLLVATAVLAVAQQSEAGSIFDKISTFIDDGIDGIEKEQDPGNKRVCDTIKLIKQRSQENIDDSVYVNATIKLEQGFINGTNYLAESRNTILNGIEAAGKIVAQNPEGAKKLTQQAWADAQTITFYGGLPYFYTLGRVWALSNDGARPGLLSASQFIQKAGFSILDVIEAGDSLFNEGSNAGGRAAVLALKAYRLAVESAFAGAFNNIQKSTNASFQGLRDAQRKPIYGQVENLNCGAAAKGDSESSVALKYIDEAANKALQSGANPELVEKLKEVLKCALDDLVVTTDAAKRTVVNIRKIAGINTLAATIAFFNQIESLRKELHELASKVYLGIGDVLVKSENPLDNKVEAAILDIEKGVVGIFFSLKKAGEIVVNGLRYGGDAPALAIDAGSKSGYHGKITIIQSFVKCAETVFSIL